MAEFTIIYDNREKKPLDFSGEPVEAVSGTLTTGDYSVPGFEDTFAIERKSGQDLANSVGNDRDRFQREMERSRDLDEFKVMIECPRWWFYDYLNESESPYVYSRINPKSVTGTVEAWSKKYNTTFRWAGSRAQAALEVVDDLRSWLENY